MTRERISRPSSPAYAYSAARLPSCTLDPGERVLVETWDARAGRMFAHPAGPFELPELPAGEGNPLTGPLAVRGARPGDALVVTIEEITCVSPGWLCAREGRNPASAGVITGSHGRICELTEDGVTFAGGITLPLAPMVGCLGVALPGEPLPSSVPGRHGGNMDHSIVRAGATVHLPVLVPDALLYVGDAHAVQGDGELSGTGVEVRAEVALRVDLERGAALRWPWVTTADRVAVLTSGPTFDEARRAAVDAMITALGRARGLDPADALALLSAVGDLRVGQATGGVDVTLRLELPAHLGVRP